jgi:hypothetical protein
LIVRLALVAPPLRQSLRQRPQQFGGDHVKLRGLVDGLDRILPEQLIGPRDQVVDVFHYYRFLVGNESHPCDSVWLEWVRLEVLPLCDQVGVSRIHRLQHIVEPKGLGISEGQHVPVALRGRLGWRGRRSRIENEVEPAHRFLEALILA